MKKIFLILITIPFLISSCDLDTFPNDELTPEDLGNVAEGAMFATDGNYAMFKDILEFDGNIYTGNTYIRHFMQMAEFPGDNSSLSARTSDPLYEAIAYKRSPNVRNVRYLWWIMYKVINGANNIIETISDDAAPEFAYIKGENLVLRATAHLHLSMLWSRPYSHGRDNPGVILRTASEPTAPTRATVGEVYDQIVADLELAVQLMGTSERRGKNAGYISKSTAQGLLSRVYLYMERNEDVIRIVNDMLSSTTPEAVLESTETYPSYFANALISKETLWCIGHTADESRASSSLASMFLKEQTGWGEIFPSDPYLDLLYRYPSDVRSRFILPQEQAGGTYTVRWPVPGKDDFYIFRIEDLTLDSSSNKYYFEEGSTRIYVETEKVNGFNQNHITIDGTKHKATFSKKMGLKNGQPQYYMSKFSYQDGNAMLSSPVIIRWAEVILNRAEAYAKTNQNDKSLADVNIIRKRAGLPSNAMFSAGNMQGYTSVLDVVLDERRLELSFEGHRPHDVYRNKRSMDRKFAGAQPWEIVDYTDNRTVYLIPTDEILQSGIPQNP